MMRILLADADDSFRERALEHLRKKGFTVDPAIDGIEAMSCLRDKRSYGLVLTNLQLPGMDGLDVLQCAQKEQPQACVYILGQAEQAGDAVRALGARDYIRTPLSMFDLEVIVTLSLRLQELKLLRATQQN